MSQISPPIRILLVLAVAVLGVYMMFLRPKPVELPPAEPAGTSTSQPGQVRDAAEDAVDAANGQLAQQESVDGVDAGEAAAGTAAGTKYAPGAKAQGAATAEPAEDLKGMPKSVRQAIRKDKVLVVLFSNGKSYDDKAVEKAVAKINRWDGRVFVHTAPLRKISRYGRIARGVNVEQSPTVVVADRELRAETLVGYVDRTTIDQAVVDARRNAEGIYVDSYLKAADKVCFAYSNRVDSIPFAEGYWTRRQLDRRMAEAATVFAAFAADYKAVTPTKKWRALHNATVADFATYTARLNQVSAALGPKTSSANIAKQRQSFNSFARPLTNRVDKRFDSANLPRCGSHF